MIITEHFHLVWVRLFNWNQRGKKINADISKVGLVFAYRNVKDGCTYYTPAPTQTHRFTPSVGADRDFFLLITENKVSALPPPPPRPPPHHTFLVELMRMQTAHPTDTLQNLPRSLQQSPFSPYWSLPASLQAPSILLWFLLAFRDDTNEMLNY